MYAPATSASSIFDASSVVNMLAGAMRSLKKKKETCKYKKVFFIVHMCKILYKKKKRKQRHIYTPALWWSIARRCNELAANTHILLSCTVVYEDTYSSMRTEIY